MGRMATERVVLSDGTVIPKGQSILVDSSKMWDSKVHPASPDRWDGYRFLRMREDPKKRDIAPLTTTSPEQFAFGYGVHACPGRFFAGNEIKIALAAILLKYEVKFEEGQTPRAFDHGFTCNFDFSVQMSVKRRKGEGGLGFDI
jgi:cytochrome P450